MTTETSGNVHAMILAAGLGTRLRPLTDRVPKPLVEVAGRPLIEYALANVARAGIGDVVINLHHLAVAIREHLGDGSRFGLNIRYSLEDPLLGTGGGILHARELLGDSTVVTLNSDTIIDIELGEVLAFHRSRRAAATLVLRKDPLAKQYGVIETETDGRIGTFLEHRRPGTMEPLEAFMYTGVQVLEPRVFDYMPADRPFSVTAVTYPQMLTAGEPIYGYRFDGRWLTVGTLDEKAAAERALADG